MHTRTHLRAHDECANVKLLQGHFEIGLSVEMRYEFKSKNQPVYMQIT